MQGIFPPEWRPSAKASSTISFLDLPREMRDMIYQHSVPINQDIPIDVRYPNSRTPYVPIGCRDKITPPPYANDALLRTCHQIHYELSELLYSSNTFSMICTFSKSAPQPYAPAVVETRPCLAPVVMENMRLPTGYAPFIRNVKLRYAKGVFQPFDFLFREACRDAASLEKVFKNVETITVETRDLMPLYISPELHDMMHWIKTVQACDGMKIPQCVRFDMTSRSHVLHSAYAIPNLPVGCFEEALKVFQAQSKAKSRRRLHPD